MTSPPQPTVAYWGSDSTWEHVSRALARQPIALTRLSKNELNPRTTTGVEIIITDLRAGDAAELERLREVKRWRGASPLLVLWEPGEEAAAVAARLACEPGVMVWRWFPAVPGEDHALGRLVEALLAASPGAAARFLVRGALAPKLAPKEKAASAFAIAVVERLEAGKGLPRRAESRVGSLEEALARAAGLSLRRLEERLKDAALPAPRALAGHVAVIYTALLACSRERSLEWAAGQAGVSAEQLRRWRRRLALEQGLPPGEVAALAGRRLAETSGLPAADWTALLREAASWLGEDVA